VDRPHRPEKTNQGQNFSKILQVEPYDNSNLIQNPHFHWLQEQGSVPKGQLFLNLLVGKLKREKTQG
jgi:hypothetical protein